MTDLVLAMLLQLAISSAVTITIARWLSSQKSSTRSASSAPESVDVAVASFEPAWRRRLGMGFALAAAGLIAVYLRWLRDSAALADIIPTTAVPILSDPMPILAGVIVGVLMAQGRLPVWRRAIWGLGVAMVALWPMSQMILNQPPRTGTAWSGGVCLQTTDVTCGPAAGATLLAHYDIDATESELARWSLTRKGSSYGRRFGSGLGAPGGTHLMGLMRGLRMACQDSAWRPRAASVSLEGFRGKPSHWPAIVSVRLTQDVHEREPQYADRWGWNIGVAHTLVFYGFEDSGKIRIGDPGVGAETWDFRALEDLWTGEVIWLERRD